MSISKIGKQLGGYHQHPTNWTMHVAAPTEQHIDRDSIRKKRKAERKRKKKNRKT